MIVEIDEEAGEYRQRAETTAEGDHLRRQAEILARACHPGVVQLLGWDGTTLRLGLLFADRPGGADDRRDTTAAAVVAATTIADLHDLGIAHRHLRAEHLLWDETGAPVWCGFGHATAGVDPDGPDAASDVTRLAGVLLPLVPGDPDRQRLLAGAGRRQGRLSARQLSQRLATPVSPRPLTRLRSRRQARSESFWREGRVLTATTRPNPAPTTEGRAKSPSPRDRNWPHPHRPPNRPSPATEGPAKSRSPRDRNWPHPRRVGWALAISVVAGAAVLTTVAARAAGGRRDEAAPSQRTTSHPAAPGPAAIECPPVDLGCGPLPHADGVVAVAAGRYRIGEPGDIVVIGRWGCRDAVPALLRPATGEVWVFSAWAPVGTTLAARLLTSVPGADSLQVEPGNHGCDTLAVVGAGNLRVALNAGGSP